MNAIRILISLLFSTSLYATCPLLNPYTSHAKEWIQIHFIDDQGSVRVPLCDLELLANFLYLSSLRSQTTLIAQETTVNSLNDLWHGYQNISKTRRNPSIAQPFALDYDKITQTITKTLEAQREYLRVGQTYAHAAQTVLKENSLQSATALDAITALRQEARHTMAQEFLSVKERLGDAFTLASTYLNRAPDCQEQERNLKDFFIDLSLPLLLKSFLDWENLNTTATKEVWHILHTLINTEITVWNAIEESRSGFYDAHYRALSTLIKQYHPEKAHCPSMFDQNGLIPVHRQLEFLWQ